MKKSRIVGTIIAAVIIVIGVFALVYNGVLVFNEDLKYFSYKSVDASVSSVQSSYVDGETFYKATYSFSINGASYACNSDPTDDDEEYIIGSTATVRYDPNNPSSCFVVESGSVFHYLYLGLSCIVLIIGIKLFDKQLKAE